MNKRYIVISLAVVTLAIFGWLYYQPYQILGLIREAALNGESEALKDYVDFPSLRESVKENLNVLLARKMVEQDQNNPFAALGTVLAGKLADQLVDSFVSARSIVALTQGQRPSTKEKSGNSENNFPANQEMADSKGGSHETKMGYDNCSRFSIRFIDKSSHREKAVLYLRRYGLSWKLAAVKLPFEELPLAQKSSNYVEPPPKPPVNMAPPPSTDLTKTIHHLKTLLEREPQNYQAWVDLGNAYFDSKQPTLAVEAYTKALSIDGSSPDVHSDLGIMYRNLGRPTDAITEFTKATQLDPKHVNSRFNIGLVCLYDLKDYSGAVKAWEAFLTLEPTGERADRVRNHIKKIQALSGKAR